MATILIFLLLCSFGIQSGSAHRVRRMVDSEDAGRRQFPYIVSLRDAATGTHFCGGSILHERFILTAAHCLRGINPKDLYIIAGTNVYDKYVHKQPEHYVEKISIHIHYDQIRDMHDIALIKLKKKLKFTRRIQKISIHKSPVPVEANMLVSGWGRTYYDGALSSNLQFLNVTEIPLKKCRKEMDNAIGSFVVTKRNICTYDGPHRGTCSGDSGGPLVYKGELAGIVAWSVNCAAGFPDVYVNVSAYAHWVDHTIAKLKLS